MWIDTHCHTRYSNDNWLEPVELIRRARALGLDAICVTEHDSVDASAVAARVARQEGFVVLRGVEISTDHGHLLAYGVQDDSWNVWGRDHYLPLQAVIERINSLGGICVPAHPYRNIGAASFLERLLDVQGIAAVETHNGSNSEDDNELALAAADIMQLPGLGGSDCHKVEAVGRCATWFEHPVADIGGFVAAVRARLCHGAYRVVAGAR
jgi:predicted metal-dependent phosphoesterase TrpH